MGVSSPGALVLASAVPFGRVTAAPETATDSSGVATDHRPPDRPACRSSAARRCVFFLRARKSGDNVLAGISTRRLVQIKIVPG